MDLTDPIKANQPPTEQTVTTPLGQQISTYDYGGHGRTILFAHAASFHGRIWNQVTRRLTEHFHCVSFDFPGHGKSYGSQTLPPPSEQFWPSLFADIPHIVEELGLTRPLLGAGHSLGGAGLISAQISQPDLFEAIWTYEPIVFEQDPTFVAVCEMMASRAEQRRASFPNIAEAVANFRSRPPFDTVDPDVLDDYVKYGFVSTSEGIKLRCPPNVEAMTYRNGANHQLFDDLTNWTSKGLVGFGSLDPNAASQAHKVADQARLADVEPFEQLTHLGPLEDPAAIAGSIARFFDAG